MSPAPVTKRCVVRGKVQGVFFRAAARDEALRLGVDGWARNRSDGSVEVVVRGEDAAVQAMLRWLWRGPRLAKVSDVEVEDTRLEVPPGFTTG